MKTASITPRILGYTSLFIAMITLVQCRKKPENPFINPAFTEKISAFTSGTISSESTIRVVLAEEYQGNTATGSGILPDVFKFKPDIRGQAYWLDKRTLEFRPEERLKSGSTYTCRFNLSKLMEVPRELSVLEFNFTVVKQVFSVSIDGYHAVNENDLVWNQIKGSINTSDYIDNETIEGYFTAVQENIKLKMVWDVSPDRRTFHFTLDSVKRSEKPGMAKMHWEGKELDSRLKGDIEIPIPALGDFSVLSARVVQWPDAYLQIMFSDPIRKNQNFEGLVYLENHTDLNYTVNGNILKVFPSSGQSGSNRITVASGLLNVLGYPLKNSFEQEITFELPKPAVRLSGRGVILPSTQGMIFPFEAVNLNAVDIRIIKIFEKNIGYFLQVNRLDGSNELKRAGRLVHRQTVKLNHEPVDLGKWNRFYLDLGKLIQPDPGSIYRIEISFKKSYSLYFCDDQEPSSAEDTEWEDADEPEEASYWDSYEDYYDDYYEYGYDYDWDERDNPCSSSYYTQNRWVARNILASDLGIIAKAGEDNTVFCAVTNLVSTTPVANAEVTLYDFQHQAIASGITDHEGFVAFTATHKPFLLIASSNKQRGYLRLDDGSSLSLGAFDVSGEEVQKGIKGFIYGERGVWRPGDTLFLSFLLEDREKKLPALHPVVFELYTPQGQLYARTTKASGINGFYTLAQPTGKDVPTGNWNLKVKVGSAAFEKLLKIETIKPNRLKINLDFRTDLLSSANPDYNGELTALWLHGAKARNLKATVNVMLTTAPTLFKNYKTYQFSDPSRTFSTEEQTVFEGITDETGRALVPYRIRAEGSPGMLKASFTVRVFEKSGEFSIDRFSLPFSPYKSYVGISTPSGDKRGMLLTDTTHSAEIVTLDEKGNLLSRSGLEVTLYKLNWRNWWESSEDELADYVGNTYNQPVLIQTLSTPNGRGKFTFRINRPEWGRFYIRVLDPESGHSAGKIIYIDWPGWAGRPMRENTEAASILSFNTDKPAYRVGESAEILIPSGGKGRALMSVENGSRILVKQWITLSEKETRITLPVTAAMAPNVYVSITLIQPHASSENDMPVRLYGILPVLVEDPGTRLSPVIGMPASMEPGQKIKIRVNEKSGREMTYTLAMVEEGLLDLTRFKTPDPWSHFYAREALGVKTWDLYDMVIGAYGGKLESILGIGGDDGGGTKEPDEKANRFKPVVKFLGPFSLKAGSFNNHSIEIPNYIGSVRVMVVAAQQGAYGFAEKTVPVKKPLMILATLPRIMGPGETVKLPVTVFALDNQVSDVKIEVRTNDLLSAAETVKSVRFDQPGDKIIGFDLKVAQKTGIGRVKILATSGKLTSEYEVELDVRTPNPPVTTYIAGIAEKGSTWKSDYNLPGMEGSNTAILEVSGVPPINAVKRLRYLLQYPHGCIEQTTSSAFAQLYLAEIMELDERTANTMDAHIKAGIRQIRTFQLASGGLSYWPGESQPDSWGSSYAGHFMLEAEKKGYILPAGFKTAWIRSQKQTARQWSPATVKSPYHQNDLEQAYRLYTLALAGEPETAAMNRLREQKSLSLQAKWRLAAAFGLTGQHAVALELIGRESTEIQPYIGFTSSYGSRERDWAMILETLLILKDKLRGAGLARKISESLSSDQWLSTQSTAYCLLAMARFSKESFSGRLSFTYRSDNGKEISRESSRPLVQITLPVSKKAKSGHVEVSNRGKGLVFTRVIMEGIPEAGAEEGFSHGLNLEVSYRTPEGEVVDVKDLKQGSDFFAVVSVKNTGDFDYRELALTQIFPPGWEISNNRVADFEVPVNKDFTYQDIRDDRVYTYFDLQQGEGRTFIVRLNAAYLGKYYLPGTYCEAMYDNSISAMVKGTLVEVKNPDN